MRISIAIAVTLVWTSIWIMACGCGKPSCSGTPDTPVGENRPPPADMSQEPPPQYPPPPSQMAQQESEVVPPAQPQPQPQQEQVAEKAPAASHFSVMTYNLRNDKEEDEEKGRGWVHRRKLLLRLIREQKPDLLSVQELSNDKSKTKDNPSKWFRNKLGKGVGPGSTIKYNVIKGAPGGPKDIYLNSERFSVFFPGVSRQGIKPDNKYIRYGGCREGAKKKSCNPELINSFYLWPDRRSTCVSEETSLTQEKSVNLGKAGKKQRIGALGGKRSATWAIVKDNVTQKSFFVMNVHLFHEQKSEAARMVRREQLKCIRQKIKTHSRGLPVLVMGDFNLQSTAENFSKMLRGFEPGQRPLYDTHSAVGFGSINKFCAACDPVKKIDFILSYGFRVAQPSITVEKRYKGRWPSDHCPVQVWLTFDSDPYYSLAPTATK